MNLLALFLLFVCVWIKLGFVWAVAASCFTFCLIPSQPNITIASPTDAKGQ